MAETINVVADVQVYTSQPDNNSGTGVTLQIGRHGSEGTLYRSYISLDDSMISGAVESAKLWLYCFYVDGSASREYVARAVDQAWSETAITWNNQPALGTVGGRPFTGPANTGQWVEVDITAVVNHWVNTGANNGLVILGTEEDLAGRFAVRSKENTTVSQRPYAEMVFAPTEEHIDHPATPLDASGEMPASTVDPNPPFSNEVAAPILAGDGYSLDPSITTQWYGTIYEGEGEEKQYSITDDFSGEPNGLPQYLGERLYVDFDNAFSAYLHMYADTNAQSSVLRLEVTDGSAGGELVLQAVSIDEAWSESSAYAPDEFGAVTAESMVVGTDYQGVIEFDVSPIVEAWKAGKTRQGIAIRALSGSGYVRLGSRTHTTEAFRPRLVQTLGATSRVLMPGGPMVSDAAMPDAYFSLGVAHQATTLDLAAEVPGAIADAVKHASVGVDTLDGSALFIDATQTIRLDTEYQALLMAGGAEMGAAAGSGQYIPHVTHNAGAMVGNQYILQPETIAATPVEVAIDALVGNAEMGAGAFSDRTNRTIRPEPMTVRGTGPFTVYLQEQDPFYQFIRAAVPRFWLRLNETEGNVAHNEATYNPQSVTTPPEDGEYVGNLAKGLYDPSLLGRRFVQLAGGHITTAYGTGDDGTIVMSLRTTNPSARLTEGTGGTNTVQPGIRLEDGKLRLRFSTNPQMGAGQPFHEDKSLGNTRIDDGEWHQIVVTTYSTNPNFEGHNAIAFFIDGELDLFRDVGNTSRYFDAIGAAAIGLTQENSEYNDFDIAEYVVLDRSWFRREFPYVGGDMIGPRADGNYIADEEYRWMTRPWLHLSKWVRKAWTHWVGGTLIDAGQFNATGDMPKAKAAGNHLRALACFWGPMGNLLQFNEARNEVFFSQLYPWQGQPSNMVPGGNSFTAPDHAFWGDYRVDFKQMRATAGRDVVTDEPIYWDFTYEEDLEDYDLIFFLNYPDPSGIVYDTAREGNLSLDRWTHADYVRWERIIESFHTEVLQQGIPVWISHPMMAYDLGLADEIRSVNSRAHNGSYYGDVYVFDRRGPQAPTGPGPRYGDGHSRLGEPGFFVEEGDGAFQRYASDFANLHPINHVRIVNEVDGLTTHEDEGRRDPWEMLQTQREFSFKIQVNYNLQTDENGEIAGGPWKPGTPILFRMAPQDTETSANARDRHYWIWGVPNERHVGVAVAKGQETLYRAGEYTDSPTKDWTQVFVVEPGTEVKGRIVESPIYVDFVNNGPPFSQNLVGEAFGSVGIMLNKWPEGHEYHEKSKDGRTKGGDWHFSTLRGEQRLQQVVFIDKESFWERTENITSWEGINLGPYYTRLFMPMFNRGIQWLREAANLIDPDSVRVRPRTMGTSGSMRPATVTAERKATITAEPLRAMARILQPQEFGLPDATVNAFVMRGSGMITKPIRAYGFTGFMTMPLPEIRTTGFGLPMYIIDEPIHVQIIGQEEYV